MPSGNGKHNQIVLPDESATLGELLLRRLQDEPEAIACRLVKSDSDCVSVTVRELMERANAFAARYGSASRGRKLVAVCLYHGLDLHAAFVGALIAGHIPTMIAPPSPRMEPAKYAKSFRQMLTHIRPSAVVVDNAALEKLSTLALDDFPESELIDPASVPDAAELEPWRGDPDEVALLQHSSGTTGLQKGVALSHRAIIAHNRAYAQGLNLNRADVIASWLPLYHDMGLIACFLLPLLTRVPFVEMSPFDWVLRPAALLQEINRQRATICWLPNFAFQFMTDSILPHQLPIGLDLSCVRAWVNCSEPVQHATHDAFLNRFKKFGVRREQLTASYAMAENVFAVSQSLPGQYRVINVNRRLFAEEHRVQAADENDSLKFVSNGGVLEGTELAVLDPSEKRLPENCVGEFAIRGDYRFTGYFGRDDLTRDALTSDGWYKTGDLGFIRDGEVYVTGRKKDLIIIQGRNFYPADIEKVVTQVNGVNAGRVVCFGVINTQTGTEGLVVLAEADEAIDGGSGRLALRIRSAVAQEIDCTPQDVRIVPPRWLIKSTAGKLARADNRKKYQEHFMKEDSRSPAYV
jgi:acyl-CoA synthetase (AMP-forming)/AMP-acid ligase II